LGHWIAAAERVVLEEHPRQARGVVAQRPGELLRGVDRDTTGLDGDGRDGGVISELTLDVALVDKCWGYFGHWISFGSEYLCTGGQISRHFGQIRCFS
jgi:hypothetical protein